MKYIQSLIIVLTVILVVSCKSLQISNKRNTVKVEISYNYLLKKFNKNLIIYDTLISVSEDILNFKKIIKSKYNFDLSKNDFNLKFDLSKEEINNISLKQILNNFNNDGEKILYFSKAVDDFLLVKVYDLEEDIHPKLKKKKTYPYYRYFLKSPYALYLFKFDKENKYVVYKELMFWK